MERKHPLVRSLWSTPGPGQRAGQELRAHVLQLRHTCVANLARPGRSAEAARHLLGGAPFGLLAMGQLRHQVLGGGSHLGNEHAARIV